MKKRFKIGAKARIISKTYHYFKRGTIAVAPEQLEPLDTALDYILLYLGEIDQKKSESEGQLIESMVKNDKK